MVALILGASYLKTVLDEKKTDQARHEATEKTAEQINDLESSLDSLESGLEQSRTAFRDSIRLLREAHKQEADSLTSALVTMREAVEETLQVSGSDKAVEQLSPGDIRTSRPDSTDFHRKVLAYYKRRYEALPDDLSRYELRVALSEIRQETAKRFAISVDDLNGIRHKEDLKF